MEELNPTQSSEAKGLSHIDLSLFSKFSILYSGEAGDESVLHMQHDLIKPEHGRKRPVHAVQYAINDKRVLGVSLEAHHLTAPTA